jgi:hypothetical protein
VSWGRGLKGAVAKSEASASARDLQIRPKLVWSAAAAAGMFGLILALAATSIEVTAR